MLLKASFITTLRQVSESCAIIQTALFSHRYYNQAIHQYQLLSKTISKILFPRHTLQNPIFKTLLGYDIHSESSYTNAHTQVVSHC